MSENKIVRCAADEDNVCPAWRWQKDRSGEKYKLGDCYEGPMPIRDLGPEHYCMRHPKNRGLMLGKGKPGPKKRMED